MHISQNCCYHTTKKWGTEFLQFLQFKIFPSIAHFCIKSEDKNDFIFLREG